MKVSKRDIQDIRKAVYDLIWQTAHLYIDAPGGKLACPQRTKLERFVGSKIMTFDFMIEKANDKSELKEMIDYFIKGLEDNFQALVYDDENQLAFYQERKGDCLDAISKYIHE